MKLNMHNKVALQVLNLELQIIPSFPGCVEWMNLEINELFKTFCALVSVLIAFSIKKVVPREYKFPACAYFCSNH